jgi:hypothetical protein
MGARRTVLAVVLASLAATSCLYFTDLGGLAGGVSPDASTPSPNDAAASPDGTRAPTDGGADADADAALPTRVCEAGVHDFCVDFDDGKLTIPPWSALSRDGTLVVEDGLSVSPTKALHATLPARGGLAQTLRDRAFKNWGLSWRAVHAELDIFVVTPTWRAGDKEMELVELSLTSDTTAAGAGLFIGANGIIIVPSKAGEPHPTAPPFPYDTWTHLTFDIDASHYRITAGAQVLEATHATVVSGANADIVGLFGLSSYSDPICAFDVRYDNIVVDFK